MRPRAPWQQTCREGCRRDSSCHRRGQPPLGRSSTDADSEAPSRALRPPTPRPGLRSSHPRSLQRPDQDSGEPGTRQTNVPLTFLLETRCSPGTTKGRTAQEQAGTLPGQSLHWADTELLSSLQSRQRQSIGARPSPPTGHTARTHTPTHSCTHTHAKHVSPCLCPQQLGIYNSNYSTEKTSLRPPWPRGGCITQQLTAQTRRPPPVPTRRAQVRRNPTLRGSLVKAKITWRMALQAACVAAVSVDRATLRRDAARTQCVQSPTHALQHEGRKVVTPELAWGPADAEHARSPGRKCGLCTSGSRSAPKASKLAQQRTRVPVHPQLTWQRTG